jgi:hypothetical protein
MRTGPLEREKNSSLHFFLSPGEKEFSKVFGGKELSSVVS